MQLGKKRTTIITSPGPPEKRKGYTRQYIGIRPSGPRSLAPSRRTPSRPSSCPTSGRSGRRPILARSGATYSYPLMESRGRAEVLQHRINRGLVSDVSRPHVRLARLAAALAVKTSAGALITYFIFAPNYFGGRAPPPRISSCFGPPATPARAHLYTGRGRRCSSGVHWSSRETSLRMVSTACAPLAFAHLLFASCSWIIANFQLFSSIVSAGRVFFSPRRTGERAFFRNVCSENQGFQ